MSERAGGGRGGGVGRGGWRKRWGGRARGDVARLVFTGQEERIFHR